MASYTNTLDEEKGARARNEYEIAWKQKNTPPSDGETEEYTNLLDYELKNFDLLNKKRYYKKDSFDYFGSGTHIADLQYPYLLGAHQIDNATGVLRCIELLPQHFNIKKKSIENGIVSC